MGLVPIQNRVCRDDPIWIYGVVAKVIMAYNVIHINSVRDPWVLVKLASIGP